MIRAKFGVSHQIPNPYRPPPDTLTARTPTCLCRRKKMIRNSSSSKRQISKRVLQENKPCQIFGKKTNTSYPLIRILTCAYQGVRNACFSKNLACLFSCNPCFEIRLSASLRTNWYKLRTIGTDGRFLA